MYTAGAALMVVLLGIAPEVIDRIAITVGTRVITESEIRRQSRIAAFLNREPVQLTPEIRRKTAERLIEQALLRKEMEFSRYTLPELYETNKSIDEMKKQLGSDAEFAKGLKEYSITEDELKEHLQLQIGTIRFIEFRFRPGIQVTSEEITAEYAKSNPGFTGTVPDEDRTKIEQQLLEKKVDEALDRWLAEARSQTRVEVREESLE